MKKTHMWMVPKYPKIYVNRQDFVFAGTFLTSSISYQTFSCEHFCFAGMLRKVNLELTVLDYDRIGGSDAIGKVLLGYNRKKLEKKHWAEMVDNPRRPIIHWHVLMVN